MNNVLEFVYGNQVVEFDISGTDVMINATEMGKIFGKEPYDFLKQEGTKKFIDALKNRFERLSSDPESELNAGNAISSDETIVRTERGKGADGGATWMTRVLALKFAAWLDPYFDIWIFDTIDRLVFNYGQKVNGLLREQIQLQADRIQAVKELQGIEAYQRLCQIDRRMAQIGKVKQQNNNDQMNLFRNDN